MNPLRTLLFCTSFCGDEAAWRARQRRWLDHHRALPLEHDAVFVIDDASPHHGTMIEVGPAGFYYFPNSQAPRVNRPYEVFKITLS